MSIHIRRVENRVLEHPLRPELVVLSSAGRHDVSRFLIVTLHGKDGARGFGEAATMPLWSGESAETAEWMIQKMFAPILLKKSFDHPREALALMDQAVYANPFAKSAVDTAVWDLWARAQNLPVIGLIGDRRPPAFIPTRASVGAYPAARTLKIAKHFWKAGIRTLKFKTGLPGMDDAARLRAVRDLLGDEPVFTLDYN